MGCVGKQSYNGDNVFELDYRLKKKDEKRLHLHEIGIYRSSRIDELSRLIK
jgi:hypothetical protein